jgi:hypothetical protein
MVLLDDGKGRGKKAGVNDNHHLLCASVVTSQQLRTSAVDGQAYQAVTGVQTIASAGAYGLLALKNDSSYNLIITYMRFCIDKVESGQSQLEISLGGTWVAGTALDAPVNLSTLSSKSADVTVHTDAIPTGSNLIDLKWLTANQEQAYNKEGSVILQNSGIIGVKLTTETDAVKAHGRISFLLLTNEQLQDL